MNPLGELISERIQTSGPISFAEFMELSLYHPELGYYARSAQRTGRAGDFFTSVDVGPLFGELLAMQCAEMWELVEAHSSKIKAGFDLVEAGASNGRLSRDVLDAAHRNHPQFYDSIHLTLVEESASARSAHKDTLGPHAGCLRSSRRTLPENVHGVIFANELLDALPTHAVTMTETGLKEIFIGLRDGKFAEELGEPSNARIAAYLTRAGAGLHPGWRAEVNLAAEDWVKSAAAVLKTGFLLLIDYGHDEAELYGASHSAGTLTSFSRHTTQGDLQEPGTHDITAHIDLSAICRTAQEAGLTLLARLDQTYFMMALGLDQIMNAPQGFDEASLHRRLAMKTLMLPGGLGSTHKVLIFGKNVGTPKLRGTGQGQRIT